MLVKLNKIIAALLTIQIVFISCQQNKEKSNNMINDDKMLAIKQGELYGMEFNIKVPCEIRVNDMIISKNYLSGVTGPEIINQYITKSGSQKVSIKIIHPYLTNGGLFDNNALRSLIEGTYIQTINPQKDYQVNTIKELKFPEIIEKIKEFKYEWGFDAKVPYTISSWDDAQNLENIDKGELQKQILEKYQQLWDMLQNGKVDEFMKEIEVSNKDFFMSNFYTVEKQNEYLKNLRKFYNNHKGAMMPIENFELVFSADGRGISLEQTKQFSGFGILMAKGTTANSLYTNYITLIKSKKNNTFKIQLVNSEFLKY